MRFVAGAAIALVALAGCTSIRAGTYVYGGGFTGHALSLHADHTFAFNFFSDDGTTWSAKGTWRCLDARCRRFETTIVSSSGSIGRLMPPFEPRQQWIRDWRSIHAADAPRCRFRLQKPT